MKIAVIGDTHLGRSLYQYDLTPHIRSTMYKFARWAIRKKVDAVVHLGDVFDKPQLPTRYHKILLQWLNEFERAHIPVYLLTGNHDVAGAGVISALEMLRAVRWEGVTVVDRPCVLDGMLFLPFPPSALFQTVDAWLLAVNAAVEEAEGLAVGFSHLNVMGAKLGDQQYEYRGEVYNLPEDCAVDLMINGHIHRPQRVGGCYIPGSVGGCYMPGSIVSTAFDQGGVNRRFTLVDIVHGRLKSKPIGDVPLRAIEVDASAWGSGVDRPRTTTEVAEGAIQDVQVGDVVKITPYVDDTSAIDWSEVERALYNVGAAYVKIAPAVRAKRRRKKVATPKSNARTLAKRFIAQRVKDKKERGAIYKLFEQARREVSDVGA